MIQWQRAVPRALWSRWLFEVEYGDEVRAEARRSAREQGFNDKVVVRL